MKILLLADQAEPTLWEHLDKRKLEGVELVLSAATCPPATCPFSPASPPRRSSISAATTTTDMTSIRRRAASASKIRS